MCWIRSKKKWVGEYVGGKKRWRGERNTGAYVSAYATFVDK
jgi:hypothetical protein